MVKTVYESEPHLLSSNEWMVFLAFQELCYNNRYTLARLILRKPNQWIPHSALKSLVKEVGEEGLQMALSDLCQSLIEPVDIKAESDEDMATIDLSFDSSQDEGRNAEAGPSSLGNAITFERSNVELNQWLDAELNPILEPVLTEPDYGYFCQDESHMTLEEVLHRLSNAQLRELVKSNKCKTSKTTNPEMISALIAQARSQSVLDFSCHTKSGKKSSGMRQTTLPFSQKPSPLSAEHTLFKNALNKLGRCIRVNYDFYLLVRRIHIICYRNMEHPTTLLLPALLTSFKKRKYADYTHKRDNGVWASREDFLSYEQALAFEAKVEELLGEIELSMRASSKTPAPTPRHQFTTPMTPRPGRNIATPIKTPGSVKGSRAFATPKSVKKEEEQAVAEADFEEFEESGPPFILTASLQKARVLKYVFQKWVRTGWQECIKVKREEAAVRMPGFERFERGYVYTRMMCKAAAAFGMLKEYDEELEILEALLAQRLWRRGKRASWYDRRALIQTKYLCMVDDSGKKKKNPEVLQQAREGILEALKDEDTGIVLRPSLIRRLRQVEKWLNVPEDECVKTERELRKPDEITIKATRVYQRIKLDANGRMVSNTSTSVMTSYFSPMGTKTKQEPSSAQDKPEPPKPKSKGKSVWLGKTNENINVETAALEYYENQGFKGLHAETSILTTIFGLLFWDIIFADVPGAFETPYQSAPLDMGEDSFYFARRALMERRLEEINNGCAKELLLKHDQKYREKEVWCIGVQWKLCEREDLLEIIECLGGESLGIICRLFCEDFAGRSSGVPDLVIWNIERKLCKFVEVKGPGDRPMENQKLWFDSLKGANANVEQCNVVDKNDNSGPKTGTRKRKTPGPSTAKKRRKAEDHPEEEENDYDLLDRTQEELVQTPGGQPPKKKRRATLPPEEDVLRPLFPSARISPPNFPSQIVQSSPSAKANPAQPISVIC